MSTSSAAAGSIGLRDNRLLAVLLVCGACFCATSQDSLMKYLSGGYPFHQLLTIRSVAAIPIILAIISSTTGLRSIPTRHLLRVLLRGAVLFVGFMSFSLAYAAMPLADVVTIYFTMPFIVAALSPLVLGETVGLERWLMIGLGFLGVVVMLQKDASLAEPSSILAAFGRPSALLALLSATCYAIGQLMSRSLARDVAPAVSSFYQNLIYLGASLAMALGFALAPIDGVADKSLAFLAHPWLVPPVGDLHILLGIAVLGSLAMPLFSTAYRYGEASFVASFEYSGMFWAVLYGLLLFGDVPSLATWIGSATVIGAGLLMLALDRRRRQRRRP
ncbi:MAG: DMT family transporter [Hyphomicrobiaceae bacterium]